MGVVYVALALVSGFIFTNLHIPARYRQKRSSGWDSYFHVAAWGTLFSLISVIICIPLDYFDFPAKALEGTLVSIAELKKLPVSVSDVKIGIWAIVTMTVAVVFGIASVVYFKLRPEKKLEVSAEIAQKDHLESIVLDSSLTQSTLLISLKTRKCYVGICYGVVGYEDGSPSSIAIIPMLSGFRDSETLCVEFKNNYYAHYEKTGIFDGEHKFLTLDHFKIVIPVEQIETISYFAMDTYMDFKEAEGN
ncbi:TPA: hypothetical protein NJ354_003688 [Vibrio parahaemolyticus]|uniref:hypothetical protein n=1 Tax=Vibrio alginolyticus TaxID=663 RepID=UPI0010EF1416|nr:hypothetical protein [Vibrio alginolyticus]ELA9082385.1 hypothetical protein [Vibrio alginolyticus]MCG9765398.1 hypothetical protein [Vibrio alginolyticus]TBT87114.1 hypothetical protein D5E71_15040 [Vibrio parahaemolyticus]HCG7220458.1 hypothetical protein [Vibrio parahaemolyticus]